MLFKLLSPAKMHSKTFPTFFSIRFSAPCFMFRSLIHLNLSFVQSYKYGSIFFLHVHILLDQGHFLPLCLSCIFVKIYLFILCIFRHTRRGHQISLQMVIIHHVVARNLTQDIWKSSWCS